LVLPRYYYQPAVFERDGKWLEFWRGFVKGLVISAFFIVIYLMWDARPGKGGKETRGMSKKEKSGCYVGGFVNFAIIYFGMIS
jgi:hypothetical protein